ncbi:MAG: hypothetical protein CISAcid_18150 [uncultured Acidilobus sp. CIS]|nr:MAG: hypothetical protein CISAcid_18150 [uncultured Acidilobus sp. CIS]ESQ22561.1 MAG: hypothetical protein MGAcid_11650 [uncultured Acidilobus sp. MG]ESQ22698.1 MAG: hypothetical protein MGAcid_13020 [uncultured Acidilobus sp. MG]
MTGRWYIGYDMPLTPALQGLRLAS